MQSSADGAAQKHELTPKKRAPVDRKIIGGITLYPDQLRKIRAYAKANKLSRSAVIRQLIDEHL